MTIFEALTRDVRLALRRLIRTPGFTAIAVLSLSLGIGVNTLMFSFMNAALLQPLPYPDASRLVMIYLSPPNNPGNLGPLPPPMFFLLRDHGKSFDAVGVYDAGRQVNLTDDTSGFVAERLSGHRISSTAFQALGVKPLLGRFHTAAEDLSGAGPTVVLSHALWQRRFGGRPDIVGQSALIDGQSTAIIGVMPASFELSDGSSDAWMPFGFAPAAAQGSARWLRGVARLKARARGPALPDHSSRRRRLWCRRVVRGDTISRELPLGRDPVGSGHVRDDCRDPRRHRSRGLPRAGDARDPHRPARRAASRLDNME